MKTVKDLERLLSSVKGNLEIGKLSICQEQGDVSDKDIDVRFNGNLIMWLTAGSWEDDTLLKNAGWTISSDVEEGEVAKKKVIKLDKELEDARKQIEEKSLALGKVEAYEKLFIGRSITVNK